MIYLDSAVFLVASFQPGIFEVLCVHPHIANIPCGHLLLGMSIFMRAFAFRFQEKKFVPGLGFEPQISSLALYYFSYPGSNHGTGQNLPLESNAMQALWSVTLSAII